MPKLIVQIPCYNEADSLAFTLAQLPRSMRGFSSVEWLVVDDGSEDGTPEIARQLGVHHVIQLPGHQGLGRAFAEGVKACLARGADFIVNTDADNQYRASDVPSLLKPLQNNEADLVIGVRQISELAHYGAVRTTLHYIGNYVVRQVSGLEIQDCRSGFRAFNRRTAERFKVTSRYTYTMETLIQAGHEGLRVAYIPIKTNPERRPSRLIKNLPSDVMRSGFSIVRSYWEHKRPL